MTFEEASKRVKQLTELLEKYNYEYYVLNQSSVSDAEFDRLMGELKILENEFPALQSKNSPTQRVGGEVPGSSQQDFTHAARRWSGAGCF